MLKFWGMEALKKGCRSVQATVPNPFHPEPIRVSRDIFKPRRSAAMAAWRAFIA
jgi:hypothetical protein